MEATTQFSHYPPLYFLLVGIPSLLTRGANALYSMRMVGTLVNAVLFALGLFLLSRYHPRRRYMSVGVLVAFTPMVFFVSSVVNSSGMEIAAAFAAWCAGLCVIERQRVPIALADWTSLAFVVLILTRPASPLNAAIIVITLAIVTGWSRFRGLVRDKGTFVIRLSVVIALIVCAVELIVGGIPALTGLPQRPPFSIWRSMWWTFSLTLHRLRQGVGSFGWLDTPVPEAVWVIWATVFAMATAAGLYVSSRCRRALPFLALVIVVMPVAFESPKIDSVGIYWQGRYWLPLLIGLPLVVASQAPIRKGVRRRTLTLTTTLAVCGLGVVLACAQVWSFVSALQRYEYGLGTGPGAIGHWAPPGGADFVTGLFVFGMTLFVGFIAYNVFIPYKEPLDDGVSDEHATTEAPLA